MRQYLRISATFIDPLYHGRADAAQPEWPPSPLRVFQAIVAANGRAIQAQVPLRGALAWLEAQPAPLIIAPEAHGTAGYVLSVPNNAMDLVAKAWAKGNYHGTGDSNPATHRTMKAVRPLRMVTGDAVHYLWRMEEDDDIQQHVEALNEAARNAYALGWGRDFVAVHADVVFAATAEEIIGQRWKPCTTQNGTPLRKPAVGTLEALCTRHEAFMKRVGKSGKQLRPVPPLTRFDVVGYRHAEDSPVRPHAVFELRRDDGNFHVHSQRRLMHIAGMTRHLAKTLMTQSPPSGVPEDWVERYVMGHREEGCDDHAQFAYVPLPSIGHQHADQAIRRVMLVAPVGDDGWLEHSARRLAGQRLVPEQGNEFGGEQPPYLHRVQHDNVAGFYTQPARRWASVTPVILPGHDDKKPAKTRKLIEKALAQAGIEAPCSYEWSAFSRFSKSYSAHKYGKDKKPQGYFRPDHLLDKTAVHLTLTFEDCLEVPGPLTIGAGRHCGFGLMARLDGI